VLSVKYYFDNGIVANSSQINGNKPAENAFPFLHKQRRSQEAPRRQQVVSEKLERYIRQSDGVA
jgi:hypothetical protein